MSKYTQRGKDAREIHSKWVGRAKMPGFVNDATLTKDIVDNLTNVQLGKLIERVGDGNYVAENVRTRNHKSLTPIYTVALYRTAQKMGEENILKGGCPRGVANTPKVKKYFVQMFEEVVNELLCK